MNEELKKRALELYKPPFKFFCGYVLDADGRQVADDAAANLILRIRGWGRIQYLKEAEALQDAVGEFIADALTKA